MITGATGGLGNQVLQFLVQKKEVESLSAIVRGDISRLDSFQKQGVKIIPADYDDKESLLKAFEGIDKLYFISGSDLALREKQHENVIEAAKKAGIEHVVYTSFQRKNETNDSPIAMVADVHLKTEKWLRESGLNYTILKHALYTDGLPMFLGNVMETGMIYLPAGDGKVAFASRKDMAEAASVILTTSGHEDKSYEISAPKSYSFHDVAEFLSDILGKQITYVSPSVDEFKKTLANAGVPDHLVGLSVLFGEGIKQGEFDFPDSTLKNLLGREPETPSEFLRGMYLK